MALEFTSTKTNTSVPQKLGLALAVIAVAQLMVVLDSAVVNIALPSIQRALHFSASGLEWVVNGYALAFGGLLLLGGRAGDLFGRRRVFLAGIAVFTVGSLAGGLASGSAWLVAARIFQGAGAAIVAPTALSLVADTFPEGRERNRAFGVYSAVSGAGGALGLLLGGAITNYFSWRWVLFINVPIGIALMASAPRVLASSPGRPGKLDLAGAATVTGGMAALVYGLSHAATNNWSDVTTIGSIVLGVALIIAFILLERGRTHALMPLSVLASRNRSGAIAIRFLVGAMLSAVLFFLTQYLQLVLGYSAIKAGLAFLPITGGVIVGAQVASRLIGRIGPRRLMGAGAVLLGLGLLWLSRITVHGHYVTAVLGPVVILATGLGLIFVSTTITGVSAVRRQESGVASALLNVGQQLGGSVGLAVLGTIAITTTRDHLAHQVTVPSAVLDALTGGYATAISAAAVSAGIALVMALAVIHGTGGKAARESVRNAA